MALQGKEGGYMTSLQLRWRTLFQHSVSSHPTVGKCSVYIKRRSCYWSYEADLPCNKKWL